MTPEEERRIIALGKDAHSLIENEAFNHVFQLLEKKYWNEFKKEALTPEARANVQAKAQVLDDVRFQLTIVEEAGFTATANRDKRERTEERRNQKPQRGV